MKNKTTYPLNAEGIDRISEEIDRLCREKKTDSKSTLRYRLAAEEALNCWLQKFGDGVPVTFETGRKLTKPVFQISVPGERCNPYQTDSEEFGTSGKAFLVQLGLVPAYYYNGKNTLVFDIHKKPMNPLLQLILVILSAVAVAVLGLQFLPTSTIAVLSENFILPIEDTVFRILSCVAGPMIFLSVAWGVYGIGDVYTLGVVGKKLMLSFFSVVFAFSLFGTLFYPFLGPTMAASSAQNSQFSRIFEMLLGVFPANIFSPFIDGNTLQIIMLGFIIGLALIFLGQRTASVARAVEQINYIIQFLMESISKIVPYFVFIVLIRIIWSDSLKVLTNAGQFALVFLIAYVILISSLLVYVSIRNRVSPFRLFRLCLPSYLIALSTASSAAAFESNMRICRSRLGVSNSLASFGIPLGQVLFKPTTALYYLLLFFYLATQYQVSVSISWIVTAVLVTAVSAVSTPPIPGGASATYTILFLQLGIPAEALAAVLAIDMIFDFLLTSGDMLNLLVELFHVSSKIGMRDTTVFSAKKADKK